MLVTLGEELAGSLPRERRSDVDDVGLDPVQLVHVVIHDPHEDLDVLGLGDAGGEESVLNLLEEGATHGARRPLRKRGFELEENRGRVVRRRRRDRGRRRRRGRRSGDGYSHRLGETRMQVQRRTAAQTRV